MSVKEAMDAAFDWNAEFLRETVRDAVHPKLDEFQNSLNFVERKVNQLVELWRDSAEGKVAAERDAFRKRVEELYAKVTELEEKMPQPAPLPPAITEFSDLLGRTLANVEIHEPDEMVFTLDNGDRWALLHTQDCCESVNIENVCGDIQNLIGSPITEAKEEVENGLGGETESWTKTVYRISTEKGPVVIRWLGESNGYYSESVYFKRK